MVGHLGISPGAIFADDYEVVRVLAKGGMGSLYVAKDRRTGEEVALKVLLPDLVTNKRMRMRFERESRVAAELNSPYVPRVHASGINASGVPWIAMDLLDGQDLRQYVEGHGALSLQEARAVLEKVSHALAEAHRLRLVHRDLKPENVFLDVSSGERKVKLLDFGVVKVIDGNKTSGLGTAAVGSPLWMAPEQTSAGGRIAPATDIWSLGLVTYYLLTGGHYWKAASDDSGVAGLLREMHLEPIIAPTRRAIELGRPYVFPAGFDAWFLKAMDRDSTQRYTDAAEAWAALSAVFAAADADSADTTAMPAVDARAMLAGGGLAGIRTDTYIQPGPSGVPVGETLQSLGGLNLPRPAKVIQGPPPSSSTPGPAPSEPAWRSPPLANPEPSIQATRPAPGVRSSAASWGAPPAHWVGSVGSPSGPPPPRASNPAPSMPSWAPTPGPAPSLPAPVPRRPAPATLSRWPMLVGLGMAGVLMALLTGVIVWIVLTVTSPTERTQEPGRDPGMRVG
ncbi:MAG: protein kinase [Sandaracinaceae bacterium]